MPMELGSIHKAYLVPGQPHILLAPDRNAGWASLKQSYEAIGREIERSGAELMLLYSTQWFSVIGHLFQTASESAVDARRSELVPVRRDPVLVPHRSGVRQALRARLQRPRHADRDRRLSRLSDRHRHGRRAEAAQSEQRHSRVGRLVQHLRGARRDARPRPRRARRRSTAMARRPSWSS